MKPTVPASEAPSSSNTERKSMTPLARAALDNGISFEDVAAYLCGRTTGTQDVIWDEIEK